MPEHSPLGASSAERWINCAGSAALIRALAVAETGFNQDQEPDYLRDGKEAHALGEACLRLNIDAFEAPEAEYPTLTAEMMAAVQVHLDYVRSRPGWSFVELRMHRPEFHEHMYGTTDVAVFDPGHLEIIDYKHGIGVFVEVENNPQIMYYAYMVIDELGSAWHDDEEIKLTIVQPRITWTEPVRSWTTTVGYIRRWAVEILRPAMVAAETDPFLSPGDHCRFCPAKLVCPAMLAVGSEFSQLGIDAIQGLTNTQLAALLPKVSLLKMLIPALMKEARRRLIENRGTLEGYKVVEAMADRVWKDAAPVATEYGYQPQKLLSPAMVEKEPGGKAFVHEWAYKPQAGYDVVPEGDRRKAVKIETAGEKWSAFVENIN
jgi:hypothetical protein